MVLYFELQLVGEHIKSFLPFPNVEGYGLGGVFKSVLSPCNYMNKSRQLVWALIFENGLSWLLPRVEKE